MPRLETPTRSPLSLPPPAAKMMRMLGMALAPKGVAASIAAEPEAPPAVTLFHWLGAPLGAASNASP
jgi:hypothetical protein